MNGYVADVSEMSKHMGDTLDYGYCGIARLCRCCYKVYRTNLYDSGAKLCPLCRVRQYRKEGLDMVINDVKGLSSMKLNKLSNEHKNNIHN